MSVVTTWPVLRWTSVVAAWEPTHEATKARLRTLRDRRNAISHGVTVHQRGPHGAAGSTTLMCSLNLFAAVLERRGDHVSALKYAKAAEKLESAWKQQLQATFAHTEAVTSTSNWLMSLARDVERQRKLLPNVDRFILLKGRVDSVEEDWAHLSGVGSDEGKRVDLPREMLASCNMKVGDFAVVFRDTLPSGIVNLWCLPGVSIEKDVDDHGSDQVGTTGGPEALSSMQQRALAPLPSVEKSEALARLLSSSAPRIRRPAG